jgi:hypothetical protein
MARIFRKYREHGKEMEGGEMTILLIVLAVMAINLFLLYAMCRASAYGDGRLDE